MPSIFTLFLYSGNFLMGGTNDYTDLLRVMLRQVRENAAAGKAGTSSGKERAKSFFSYIDHYTTDLGFWSFLDRQEISHLGCILSTFWEGSRIRFSSGRMPSTAYATRASRTSSKPLPYRTPACPW